MPHPVAALVHVHSEDPCRPPAAGRELPGFAWTTAPAAKKSFPATAAAKAVLLTGFIFLRAGANPVSAQPTSAPDPASAATAASLTQVETNAPAESAAGPEKPFTPTPGNHLRKITVDGLVRSCVIHLPPGLDPAKPAPLVLMLHGAAMNAGMMAGFSGMNAQSDAAKFIAVYPNGTGMAETFLTWNSGGLGPSRRKPDDVAFIRALLDDLAKILKVDPRRIYAAGMSNGGMMAYRLGLELSDRIAAIAAVGGTLAIAVPATTPTPAARPVPAIHFHGTDDRIVPYAGPRKRNPSAVSFQSVSETIGSWVKLTGCPQPPQVRDVPDRFPDGTKVRITTYGPGHRGAEVVLVDILGGGHTWPGQQPAVSLIGKSTREISANQLIWEFFQKHPMPQPNRSA